MIIKRIFIYIFMYENIISGWTDRYKSIILESCLSASWDGLM